MPNLPPCTADPACTSDAFLLHHDLPWCRMHFEDAGGVI